MTNEEILTELDNVCDNTDPVADTKLACANLVNEAYKRGSGDNMTVVMAQFIWEMPQVVPNVKPKAKSTAPTPTPAPAKPKTPGMGSWVLPSALKRKLADDDDTVTARAPKAKATGTPGVVVVKATPTR